MKLFIISDTHFGVYPLRSDRWLNMAMDWRDSFLVPLLKKHGKPGDRIVHMGDLYDNRTSINVRVLNKTVETIEMLADIMPVDVLIGNHDMWAMSDTEINSAVSIKHVNNVNIYTNTTRVKHGSKDCVYMPWINDKETCVEQLRNIGGDILFCHSDLQGCRTQITPTRPFNRELPQVSDYSGFNKVYSGHIHIRQTIGNVTFVGAPYHLDRNDVGNQKGIYIYDTEKDADKFIENKVSPEFVKVAVSGLRDLPKLVDALDNGDYVDVTVNQSLLVSEPAFMSEMDKILADYNVESMNWLSDAVQVDNVADHEDSDISADLNINIEQMSKDWAASRVYAEDTKTDKAVKTRVSKVLDKAFDILRANAK